MILIFSFSCFGQMVLNILSLKRQTTYISPLEMGVPPHINKLNPLYLKLLCASFGYIWPHDSLEEVKNCKKFTDEREEELKNK